MPIPITFRPLVLWPGQQTKTRQASPFSAAWPSTLDLLDRELHQLAARNVVLQLALNETDLRRDGLPKVNARPSHPGAVLAFDSKYGPLQYATDAFHDWQGNVRAIALGLEALRKVDRYGITKCGEQYTGWKALPASTAPAPMTVDHAAVFIANRAEPHRAFIAAEIIARAEVAADAYRSAAKQTHPDAGGSVEEFQRLQEAKGVLDAHHAGR